MKKNYFSGKIECKVMDRKWLVIVNPNAGGRRGEHEWPGIRKLLQNEGFLFDPVLTEAPMHAVSLAQEGVARGYRDIIAVGGDGTLNEVANGVLHQQKVPATEINLGMITVGTGNDWARMFSVPSGFTGAIRVLKEKKTRLQDVCRVKFGTNGSTGERFFVNLAGIGFDAEVVKRTNREKMKGHSNSMIYLWYLLTTLFSYRSTRLQIIAEERERKGEYFDISIGIGKYNGGGMMTVPYAIADDGLLDVTLIRKIGKWEVIRSLPLLFNGKIGQNKKVEIFRTRSIEITSDPPVNLEADGEALGTSPFRFEIVPSALRVIVP
ncbi:MAG: diacylglycerol/lipid kinase family protein [Bacteroidales bacterium]